MFRKVQYEIWPFVKVYAMFTWWRIRYGGAKNIPPELLQRRMEQNIESIRENLYNALRVLPEDATEEERQILLDAIQESQDVERLYREGINKKEN